MKNHKLFRLFIGLVCMILCVSLAMTACKMVEDDPAETKSTVGSVETEPTEGEPTEPEETQSEPEETQPTEPDVTEPEVTEPEETQASGSTTGPSVNTGTGGGYDPGTLEPTEPEDATLPEIVVPEPGSENNAYVETFADSGSFTTVTIPSGKQMHYRLKTSGSFLRVEDGDAAVIVGETVYRGENGVLEIALPADDSQAIALAFVNQNSEDKAFAVEILGVVGSQTNPIALESVADIQTELTENADGVWYRWIADQSGMLNMFLDSEEADAAITVGGKTVSLSEGNGQASIPVNAGDEVLIQIFGTAGKVQVSGYVAVIVELEVSEIPSQVESVTVGAGQSVIYRITGTNGKSLKLADSEFCAAYDGVLYSPDADGTVLVNLADGNAEVELFNKSAEPKSTQLYFDYPVGHKLNPQRLTELGQLAVQIPEEQDGYWYSYTAQSAGMVMFQIWTYPEQESVKTDIVIVNETTGKTSALWRQDEDSQTVEHETVYVDVNKADALTVWVNVTDIFGYSVYTNLEIFGGLYGTEELPIVVSYPSFTANVPAGETLYYEGYNMADLTLSMTGSDVTVAHNGVTYTPSGSQITFPVVTEGRNPARFAITNTGSADASYVVTFTYPVGHSENPADLVLGTNTVTQAAGAYDYCYTFTPPKDGNLTLTFDSDAQWVYTVNNLTQGIYGDSQWSDSDPVQPVITVPVTAGDVIFIRVNTYDAANMFENPAGSVVFNAEYVSAPVAVETVPGSVDAELIPGEFAEFTGIFYGYNLVLSDAKDAVVYFGGTAYYPDVNGDITVEFPESDSQESLSYRLHNAGQNLITLSMDIDRRNRGTQEMVPGLNVMTQGENSGANQYYTFTATKTGRFKITINTSSNWVYEITNLTQGVSSGIRYSTDGKKTYTMVVVKGDEVELMINTFNPETGESCEGTVEFTIDAP